MNVRKSNMRRKKKSKHKRKSKSSRVRLAERVVQHMDKIYLANLEVIPIDKEEYEEERAVIKNIISYDKKKKFENPFVDEWTDSELKKIRAKSYSNYIGFSNNVHVSTHSQRLAQTYMQVLFADFVEREE